MKHIGIDGCKAGWFYVCLGDNKSYEMGVFSQISELSGLLPESNMILVDIPMGLRDKENETKERLCDLEARRVLKNRKSSVFPAPSRQALNCTAYKEACMVNFDITGRKLSCQSWNISDKIKQMDDFLFQTKSSGRIREFHPEVGFWALNNKEEMQHNKKLLPGREERLNVLLKYCPFADKIFLEAQQQFRRKDLAYDDIIDALAGAVTAKYSQSLCTLPEVPERDSRMLPMEIVYACHI